MLRLAEKTLKELTTYFPCVVVIGPRQCGKTTLVKGLEGDWKFFDLERASDYQAISQNPDLFFSLHSQNLILDEAQLLPELFPALRVAIDSERGRKGRFIITGSSSPLLQKHIHETLAGRVALLELAPLSFSEVQKHPTHFYDWLASPRSLAELITLFQKPPETQLMHHYWLKGGYPEPWIEQNNRFETLWMDSYVQTYVRRDIAALFPQLDLHKYQLFLSLLANASGQIINYSEIARVLGVSQPTARDYFHIAHGTLIWRHLPPYEQDAKKRIVKHPKGYVRDSGLLNYLLRTPSIDLLMTHPRAGSFFEGLVIEEVLRNLEWKKTPFDAFHYRTSAGGEVDLVLSMPYGIVPIEIKYKDQIKSRDIRGLTDFVSEFSCPFGLVISAGQSAYLFNEKIAVIPFS
jgi:predicted AAA+ superfamily ATPase